MLGSVKNTGISPMGKLSFLKNIESLILIGLFISILIHVSILVPLR